MNILSFTPFRIFLLSQTVLVFFLFNIDKNEEYINNSIILSSVMYHIFINRFI